MGWRCVCVCVCVCVCACVSRCGDVCLYEHVRAMCVFVFVIVYN